MCYLVFCFFLQTHSHSTHCVFQSLTIKDDYCGEHGDMNSWIDGSIPVEKEAAITFPERILTSLTVHQIYDYTVLFAGAKDGTVTKVIFHVNFKGQGPKEG